MTLPSAEAIRKIREMFENAEIVPPLETVVERPAGKSQQSQESQETHRRFQLTSLERDQFEERAAIMEFDGGMSRQAADARALTVILAGRRLSR